MNWKEWFAENKTFFDVATPIAVVILSFLTYNVLQNQTELQKGALLPQFVVESTLSSTIPVVETVQIFSRGGNFSYFGATIYSEYEVTLPIEYKKEGPPIFLPVNGYFPDGFYDPHQRLQNENSRDKLQEIVSTAYAHAKITAIQREYNGSSTTPGYIKKLWFNSYLAISYADIFGGRHTDYFYIFPNYSYPITEEVGRRIFERSSKRYRDAVTVDDNLESVLAKASTEQEMSWIESFTRSLLYRKNYQGLNQHYFRTTGCNLINLLECKPMGPG